MTTHQGANLADTGERMIPTREGETSIVFSRHLFAYQYAKQFTAGKDVLDVGCGTGYGCRILAEQANYVLGVDYDANAIEYCRAHYSAPNIKFRTADATELVLDREFDVAVSFQVIEHMRDAGDFVDRLKKVVKEKGLILITTPNVRTFHGADEGNPFHFSEMNCEQFERLIGEKFNTYRILGVGYALRNWLRSMIQKTPLYRRVGLMLKRSSRIKWAATQALSLTHFRIVENNVTQEAIDLLAVCTNEKEAV